MHILRALSRAVSTREAVWWQRCVRLEHDPLCVVAVAWKYELNQKRGMKNMIFITSNTLFCSVVYIVLLFSIQFCFSLFGHVKWWYSILFDFILLFCYIMFIGGILFYILLVVFNSILQLCIGLFSSILFSFGLLFYVCLCCSGSFSSILFLLIHCFSFYSIFFILFWSTVMSWIILFYITVMRWPTHFWSILFYFI